jgi:hypothetical protein
VNKKDEAGLSWPLLAATKSHNVAIIQLLIDHGAHSQTDTHHHRSELHALACSQTPPFSVLPYPPTKVVVVAQNWRIKPAGRRNFSWHSNRQGEDG